MMPIKGKTMIRYFAYGSNMYSPRFNLRVPSGRFITTAFIKGYELRFHMLCSDGSGKCDAFFTGRISNRVYGAVYEMKSDDRLALDEFESLGEEYGIVEVIAAIREPGSGSIPVFMYVALPQTYTPTAIPYDWYKEIVLAGAKEHGLPLSYIKKLEKVPSRKDPDTERSRKIRSGLLAE